MSPTEKRILRKMARRLDALGRSPPADRGLRTAAEIINELCDVPGAERRWTKWMVDNGYPETGEKGT